MSINILFITAYIYIYNLIVNHDYTLHNKTWKQRDTKLKKNSLTFLTLERAHLINKVI